MPTEPDRHLTYVIAKVEHKLALSLDRALHPTGLTLAQFNALAHIDAQPGLSSADLARSLLTSPQAVGTLIRRMAAAGLVEYDQPPRGRQGSLRLTGLGSTRLEVAADVATRTEQDNLKKLTADEQSTVFEHLNRLLD